MNLDTLYTVIWEVYELHDIHLKYLPSIRSFSHASWHMVNVYMPLSVELFDEVIKSSSVRNYDFVGFSLSD